MRVSRVRSVILFFVLASGFLLVLGRSIQFQLYPSEKLERLSENKQKWNQKKSTEKFLRSRGAIIDRNNRELALSVISKSFFANPRLIEKPQSVALKLSRHLGVPAKELQKQLSQDRFFVWLKREVDEASARKIENLEILGIHASKESKRIYPHGNLARSVLGFAGRDGTGLEGVEKSYDRWLLASDQAENLGVRDALGRLLLFRDYDRQWFETYDVQLTLDLRLQKLVEDEIRRTLKETQSLSGQAIMMNPNTGEILAMASIDGERAEKSSPFRNRTLSDVYEPGSTFKIFTAAASLEKLHLSASSQVFAENGLLKVGPNTVREYNSRKFGWLTLEEILMVSSNVGAAKLGLKIGSEQFAQSIRRFGFGQKTGIDLPGEASGIFRPARDWKPIDLANISFGQGIAVTPLQLIRAVSVIANGGYLVKPHVVSKIIRDAEARELVWQAQVEKKEVFSAQHARALTEMLVAVTQEGGTGQKAAIPGYRVAGKTGTSQKLVERETASGKLRKTYSADASIVSFVGYVPAEDPAFVLLVLYDEPKASLVSGGYTAAPSFYRIASKALGLMGRKPKTKDQALGKWKPSENSVYVGRSFQEILEEIQAWEEAQRQKVELIGYGKAVREERSEDQLRIYFE